MRSCHIGKKQWAGVPQHGIKHEGVSYALFKEQQEVSEELTMSDLGSPTMRVYRGMTDTVAAEKTTSGPKNACADRPLPA